MTKTLFLEGLFFCPFFALFLPKILRKKQVALMQRKEMISIYYPNYFQQPVQIVEVNGEAGANAYNLAANSSVILLDTQYPVCYIVKTDGAGLKTVMPFDMTPHIPKEQAMMNSIEERLKRLEEMIKDGKPNSRTEQSGEHDDTASEV